jgi:hypothetical protein
MSIKVIGNDHIGSDTGIKKRINAGAEKLVFDILQATQYSNPIPSSVRELVTNACDAQREKEIAISILTGQSKVEDYYIERHGEQYEDSNFDRSYYNLEKLDKTNNEIIVTYVQNEGVGFCDEFVIQDYGVGIGQRRLEGILELGYSTKRNTSQNFGAFGLGAKVALSTGVDFYTIETVYNGKRFKANCYNYKTDFVIPRFNSKGELNPTITLSDGSVVYYEETSELNNTKVKFGVKKFNRQRFEDAVEEQLTYLANVKFFIQYEDKTIREIDFKTKVIYNSDNLIVSNSYYYNKPHIVIVKDQGSATGINYGYVDFRELEMEQLYGAVGLKCPIRQVYKDEEGNEVVIQDGVEVTPSREKVIWNDHTKEFVQKLIVKAAEEAANLIQSELKEDDFLKWIDTCRNILNTKINSDPVISALSRIIDRSEIKPKYAPNPSIKWGPISSVFLGVSVKEHTSYVKDKTIHAKSESINEWEQFDLDRIYFKEENTSSRLKDFYLMEKHDGKFISIYRKDLQYLLTKIEEAITDEDADQYQKEYDKRKVSADKLIALIKASSLFRTYEDVVVPDEFEANWKKKEDVVYNAENETNLTREELRKLNEQIVAFTVRPAERTYHRNDYTSLVWDKVEPKLSELKDLQGTIYYGTDEDGELIKQAAWLSQHFMPSLVQVCGYNHGSPPKGDSPSDRVFFWGCSPTRFTEGYHHSKWLVDKSYVNTKVPQFLKVSANNVRIISKFSNFKPISQFFRDAVDINDSGKTMYTTNPVNMLNFTIRKIRTAGLLNDNYKYYYFECIKGIDPWFKTIYNTISKMYHTAVSMEKGFDNIVDDLAKLSVMQDIATSDSIELIEQTSKELFVLSDIGDALIYDKDIVEFLNYINNFKLEVEHILEYLNDDVSTDAAKEIYSYLNWRQKFDIEIPKDAIKRINERYSFNIEIPTV